jgi:hypothetical protein
MDQLLSAHLSSEPFDERDRLASREGDDPKALP